MILSQRIRKFLITIVLTIMLAITIAFDFGTSQVWAGIRQPQTKIAAIYRQQPVVENLEGKAQEIMGEITGDPKDQIIGKAKQLDSQARNEKAELQGRAKAVMKNLEGKAQEAKGNFTNNPQDQIMGRTKQLEGGVLKTIEDIKDKVQDILN